MRSPAVGRALALLATLAAAPVASAEPPPANAPPEVAHGTAIYAIGGLGTPVGLVGLEGVHLFGRWFELSAGVGYGAAAGANKRPISNPGDVLQWAVMPRVRLGNQHRAFTAGAGISGGNYASVSFEGDCPATCPPLVYTIWANVEAGYELWKSSHLAFRAFLGFMHGFVVHANPADVGRLDLPYTGLAFGWWF